MLAELLRDLPPPIPHVVVCVRHPCVALPPRTEHGLPPARRPRVLLWCRGLRPLPAPTARVRRPATARRDVARLGPRRRVRREDPPSAAQSRGLKALATVMFLPTMDLG